MAKTSGQTFKKRQRELAKKQKKEEKAKRLAQRRGNGSSEEPPVERFVGPPAKSGEKPVLKIYRAGESSTR